MGYDPLLNSAPHIIYAPLTVCIPVRRGSYDDDIVFDENRPFAPDMGEFLEILIESPQDYRLDLELYDLEGRLVKTFVRNYPGGDAEIYWYGDDDNQAKLTIGMYILLIDYRDEDGDIHKKTEVLTIGTPLK